MNTTDPELRTTTQNSLSPEGLERRLHSIFRGEVPENEIEQLLLELSEAPIQASALAAAARALRDHGATIRPQVRPLIDTCGTGGDGACTFNISTASALVLAAAGVAVAKHGNRAVTSKAGSADVLEAAGCQLELEPTRCRELLDATGFTFLFAPRFHPAMRHVAAARKRLNRRTLFNVLGPLANPAAADFQLVGVYAPELTEVVAEALGELGSRGALVVHCEGLDEVGLHAVTRGHRLREGRIEPFALDPLDFGFEREPVSSIQGAADAEGNAELLRRAITGEDGPRSRIVALNTAVALEVCGAEPGLQSALRRTQRVIKSGAALRVLERYASSTQRGERTAGPTTGGLR
ncbi:MAG: anthranilate phosphoribosyltransferase [Planctomycetota bacterium]